MKYYNVKRPNHILEVGNIIAVGDDPTFPDMCNVDIYEDSLLSSSYITGAILFKNLIYMWITEGTIAPLGESTSQGSAKICSCESRDLFHYGCRCGYIKNERRKA